MNFYQEFLKIVAKKLLQKLQKINAPIFLFYHCCYRRESGIDEKFNENGLVRRGDGVELWNFGILSCQARIPEVTESRHVEFVSVEGSKIEGGPTYQVPLFLKERIREQVLKRHTSVPLPMVRGLPGTWAELVEKRRIIERERRGHKIPLFAFLLVLLLEPSYLEKQCTRHFYSGNNLKV